MLKLFVRHGLFEEDEARSMLEWPHSGFHVPDSVLVPDGDTDFALRLARYCARNPVTLARGHGTAPTVSFGAYCRATAVDCNNVWT